MAPFSEPKHEATMKRSSNLCHPRVNWRSLQLKKSALLIGLCVIGLSIGAGGSAFGITLDFSTTPGAYLYFVGGSSPYFEFINNSAGNSFKITGVQNGAGGNSVGLFGSISGKFYIGTVSHSGPKYTANVSGPGTLTINDGSANFTAQVNWGDIYTLGATGSMNSTGSINLSNIQYNGSNADLMAWEGDPTVAANFTFSKTRTLSQLTANRAKNSTSFSGSLSAVQRPRHSGPLSAVPTPSTVLLLGTGLVGLVGLLYRRRAKG